MNTPVEGLERALNDLIRNGKTPGLQYVVVDAASTLFQYHGGLAEIATHRSMHGETTMMAYSMSKTITAAAVLQLVESNKIRLDEPVARYLEWQPYGGEITVRQLLSHTSGIPNPIPLRWVHPMASHDTFNERAALTLVLQRHPRLAWSPGTKFAYSNIGYWLLGAIVEQASGEAFTSYVASRVLRLLGIEPDEIAYTVKDSASHAAGYLEKYSMMNVIKSWLIDRDLIGELAGPWLRIRDHYLNGPAFGGLVGTAIGFGRFLQDQLREHSRLFSDSTRALFTEQQRTTRGAIPMTLGWHIGAVGNLRYLFKEGGGGGFHSMMRLYPAERIGTVLMTNATGINVRSVLDVIDRLVFRVSRVPGRL
jgi:D-alanyl-D-alanine carboxypeptidase